jgi:lipoprotein-anchoring transpeptidase ErfK/SrfK
VLRRSILIAAAVLAVAAPSAVAQQPPSSEPRIAQGVFAGGVDLSGLTIQEATDRLAPLGPALARDILVSVAGRRFHLLPADAALAFEADRTAKRAYYAGRDTPPAAGARLDVPLAVTFKRSVVKAFVAKVDRSVYLAARDATVKITLRHIYRRKDKTGRDLDGAALRTKLEALLTDPAAERVVRPGRAVIQAKVKAAALARRYGTIVTVDKSNFKLRVFKRLKFSKSYGVAVGAPAYPTPSGLFSISNKQVNPTWTAPNSPWAGEMAGQSVSGGAANNPLKARWMGIVNGVGIHGTGQEWSIGSRASHGCIRMRVADVIDLYPRIPVGSPVLIK